MQKKSRTCVACNLTEETFSKTKMCLSCTVKAKTTVKIQEEKEYLSSLGYVIIGEPEKNDTGHRKYTLISPCCKREFSPVFGNLLKQIKHNKESGNIPCRWCGGERRISNAMAGYVSKFGATYDLDKWEDYRIKVRRLSEKTYHAYRHIINPLSMKRGKSIGSWHLDHKVSIIWCFKNNISPEKAASLNNLQMLSVSDNLQKGRNNISDEAAMLLLETPDFDAEFQMMMPTNFKLARDIEDVYQKENVIVVRENEWVKKRDVVVSRARSFSGKNATVGARECKALEISKDVEKRFLDTWHIQGYLKSIFAVGLYYKEELVSVMTFAKPRYAHKTFEWELLRLCTKANVNIAGGANKMFSTFVSSKQPKNVVSYSLNRWGEGKVYNHLGFQKVASNTSARYLWHFDGKIRSWRASIILANAKNIPIKNTQISDTVKIADPGSTTWHWQAKT